MMKEQPILFNDEMVRAILDGRKTQARRVIKRSWPTGEAWGDAPYECMGRFYVDEYIKKRGEVGYKGWEVECPFGVPGDRLWVREAWMQHNGKVLYRADGGQGWEGVNYAEIKWRPSTHMPRWASRITLEVVNVRVERLQEMHEGDVFKEWEANPWVWVIEFKRLEAK